MRSSCLCARLACKRPRAAVYSIAHGCAGRAAGGKGPMRNSRLVLFLGCALALPLIAQIQNARIEGTVQDASGALIPGAKLAIINNRTETKLEAGSDSAGFYVFPT